MSPKFHLLLMLFFGTLSSMHAQQAVFGAPDYAHIQSSIQDSNSPFFYPLLFERFSTGDSSLNVVESRMIYYGYRYEDAYSPYAHSSYKDSLDQLFTTEEITEKRLFKVLHFTDSILSKKPFDLRHMNARLFALEQLGDTVGFDRTMTQARVVLDALMSSGDGTSKADAFSVIYVSNEYDLLNFFGLQMTTQSLIGHHDVLELAENEAGLEELYFDIHVCLEHLNGMFDED